jgi:hypothetical protein
MLNNNLNKMEIAGMIASGIGVAAGLGIAVYTHFKCKKESKEIEGIMETVSNCSEEIDELLKATQTITEENEKEFLEILNKTQELMKEQGMN